VPCDTGVRVANAAPLPLPNPLSALPVTPILGAPVSPVGLSGLSLSSMNSIAGTPLGRALGFPFPVKTGAGGALQPFNPANGQYLSFGTNPGLAAGSAGTFSAGFASGFATAQGAPGLVPVGTAGNIGYIIGQILGTFVQ